MPTDPKAKAKTEPKSGIRQLTVDLPTGLHDRLSTEADARGVPLKWLAARILAEAELAPAETFSLTRSAVPATEPGTI